MQHGPTRRGRVHSKAAREDGKMKESKLKNFYEAASKIKGNEMTYYNPNAAVPQHPAQVLIVAPTGAGKTNFLLNTLEQSACYDHINVCAKDLEEPLYRLLKHEYPEDQDVYMTSDIKEFPTVDQADAKKQTANIFDDMMTDKKAVPTIIDHFARGRKKNESNFYLSQRFFNIPKTVREQLTDLFLRNLRGKRDLKTILNDFSLNVDLDELVEMYKEATHNPMDFFHIALRSSPERMFQRNFTPL